MMLRFRNIYSYKRDILQLKLGIFVYILQQNNTLITKFVMTSSVFVNDETPHEGCGRWMGECCINSVMCRGCFCFKSVCIPVYSHIFGATCDPDRRHPSSVKNIYISITVFLALLSTFAPDIRFFNFI
jgi:hypothetical protein